MNLGLRDRIRAACEALPEPFTRAQIAAEIGVHSLSEVLRNEINKLAGAGEIVRDTDASSRGTEQRFRRGTLASQAAARRGSADRAAAIGHIDGLIRSWTSARTSP